MTEAAFSNSLEHGLTLKEYEVLTCALDGQITDSEIKQILLLTDDEMHEVVDSLVSKELLDRRKGVLTATYEGNVVQKRIAKDA